MGATERYEIGSKAICDDGDCGKVLRVVVDPVARALTHLVVEPGQGDRVPRLVPVEVAEPTPDGVRLHCRSDRVEGFDQAELTWFDPHEHGDWDYKRNEVLAWPYFGLGAGVPGAPATAADVAAVVWDRVPVGEVQVHKGDPVHAADGDVGRVRGLVVDPADHGVTHVLLDQGHLWTRKRVAIPIRSVTRMKHGVEVTLTTDEIRDLPAVDVD